MQKLKGQIRTGFKLKMGTVVMFASLPNAVNFFSKPSDQYYIAVAFLYFNMLRVVQFLQYTIRQNKNSPQTTNVTFDGSCSRKKTNDMIYFLNAIRVSPGGSSTVHIYTQTIHRTMQNKQYIEQHNNFGRVRAVPRLS